MRPYESLKAPYYPLSTPLIQHQKVISTYHWQRYTVSKVICNKQPGTLGEEVELRRDGTEGGQNERFINTGNKDTYLH